MLPAFVLLADLVDIPFGQVFCLIFGWRVGVSRAHGLIEMEICHVGPMADDFHAAFGLGADEKRVSPNDLAGLALAAAEALK